EAEAAEYLGVAEETLRRWRRRGRIGWIKIGDSPRFTEHHLRAFLEAPECPATASPTSSPSSPAPARPAGMSSGGKAANRGGVRRALQTAGKPGNEPES